ncbi:hypothetical protein COU58_00175 [Candidatus Pacearchaeota archaeon CG10_big_fil_rev_8_21_14_0_10_32_42]|nr:MAG: hypothetical protein COU58_00175 [Candidatus Pacearchaeota archaeon CG10_big_fil_rev_8_21_14_0_10_32_42]
MKSFKEGDLIQIVKPDEKRTLLEVKRVELKILEEKLFPKLYYSGYGIKLIFDKNLNIYLPERNVIVLWYENMENKFAHPFNTKEIKFSKIVQYIDEMQMYEPPYENSKPQIDLIND